MEESLIEAVLRDWRTAPVSPKLRAVLGLLEKLTLLPEEVSPEDVQAVRAVGASDDELEDALMVCVLFNTYVRLADTFEFEIPPREGFDQSAEMLLSVGYTFAPPLKWLTRGAVR